MRTAQAAYRTSAARQARPGFQGAAPSPRGRGGYVPPRRPANDNVPSPRKPANDNIPGGGGVSNPRRLPVPGYQGGLTNQGKRLLRGIIRGRTAPLEVIPDFAQQSPTVGPSSLNEFNPFFEAFDVIPAPPYGFQGGPISFFGCTYSGGGNSIDRFAAPAGGPSAGCLQLQSGGTPFGGGPGAQILVQWNEWIYGHATNNGARYRTVFQCWRNGNPQPETLRHALRRNNPMWIDVVPLHWPWVVDPFSLPLLNPAPFPEALPYRVLPHRRTNPNRAPQEQPRWGPFPAPFVAPVARPMGYQRPVIRTQASVRPGSRPAGSQGPANHDLLPPGPGTKEVKARLGGPIARAVLGALNATTEAFDWINAIWWAIDPAVRPRGYRDPYQKAKDIYRLASHVDMTRMVHNILLMQAQDAAIGRFSKLRSSQLRKQGFNSRLGIVPENWAFKGLNL